MALWTETYGLPAAGARAAYLYDTFAAGATADTARTALQMAIWNVLYDTDNSVTSGAGTFYVAGELDGSNPITAAANAYLSSIPVDLTGYSATWLQLTYCNAQNQCTDAQDFVGPGPVLSQVTESSSFALFSLSLVALAAAFVRKSRSSAISLPTSPKA